MSASVGHQSQGAAARSADKTGRAATANKPQPTPEQMRLAQISQKSDQDDDLRTKVTMVANLGNCDAETASFALHDCGLDVQAAVDKLLEEGDTEFRQQVITKKKSGKGVAGSGEPAVGAETNSNGKENGIQAEASADRGGRRVGSRPNAPPRMQSNRGGSSARGRNEFSNNVPQSDTKDASDLNGDVEQNASMHPRGSGRGRGRGRGGWHSTRGPRNFSRPSRYDRSQAAAASGSADGGADTSQRLHVDGLGDAVLPGSSNGGHRPIGSSGRGPAGLDGVNSWEVDGDEWTGSLKESQVFTARALDGASSSISLPQGMTIDSNGSSFGAATFNGPTGALSSSLSSGNNAYSNVTAAESGNPSQVTHREGGVVRHASATDDLSRVLTGAVAGASVERMQASFASAAVDQAMYINSVYDRQLASDTIKNAIGIPTSVHTIPMPASSSSSAGSAPGASQAPTSQQLPSKTKTPKTKLPPPTRIPTAAVEMPHKTNSVPTHVLGVQFGNLDLGPEAAAPLDAVVRDKQQQVAASVPSSLPKTSASSAVGLSGILGTATTASNLSVNGVPSGAIAGGAVAAVPHLPAKASEVTRLAPSDQQTGAASSLSQQAVASSVGLSHAQSSQPTSAAAPQHLPAASLPPQSSYLPAAGLQATGASVSAISAQQQQQLSSASNQYAASVHVLPPQQPAVSASPVAVSRQSTSSTGVAAAVTSPSALPITTAAPFSASAINAAMFAAGSGIGALPPAAAAGSHLYGNYPQMFATLPPNIGAGAGGYSGMQNAAFANMGYMADGSIYASHYYGDGSYDTSGGNLGGSGVASATAASSLQSTSVGGNSSAGSTSAASATAAGSRTTSASGKQPPPAPGLPPGIGLPLHSTATPTYMNMAGPGHMTIGGTPYFASPMYSYDEFQKLQHSLTYYDPSQYQLISSQAAGPAGQFTVGADGKIGLLDGGQQGMVAGGVAGAGAQLASVASAGQPQSGVAAGAAAAGGGGSAAGAAGIPLPQHYGAAAGSPAGGAAAGAGLHHGYPQYYIPYSPSVFPAAMHSNTGLGAAALTGAAASVNYAKGSGYGSLYQPTASAVSVGGTAAPYDDVGHMQDYGSKAAHVYNSSGQQGSAKNSVANMSTMPAGGGNSGVASVTHSGSSAADVTALYRHPMTPVAAYAHANPNSHLSSQTGGPMGAFTPYLMTQQQVVMQSSQGSSQDSGPSGRSAHAQQMSAASGAKTLGSSSGGAGKTSGQYSSGGAGSWPQY